jgi:hypothetical protein
MIRPATEADIPRIVELGRMLHQESDEYRDISYDGEKVAETMRGLIDGSGVIFLYEQDGQIRGGLAGTLGEFWFSREKVSGDFSLFVEPEARNGMIAVKLVLAFRVWSKLCGARRLNMGVTTGIQEYGTSRLYTSLGLRRTGTLFTQDL